MSAREQSLDGYAWDIADILRGKFEQSEFGKIILPFTVMRRLDCALAPVKAAVVQAHENMPEKLDERMQAIRLRKAAAGLRFWNTHKKDFAGIAALGTDEQLSALKEWMAAFSPEVRDVLLYRFGFLPLLQKLEDKNALEAVMQRVARTDLRPVDENGREVLGNAEMGRLFEHLIRKFAEMSNKTAGEHYTPREVIHLLVDLLFVEDREALTGEGVVRDIYDPACGTGGMLTAAEERIHLYNKSAVVRLHGQENSDDSYGICVGDMLVKGHDPASIAPGNTLTQDAHLDRTFHYMISNPPYGMDWKDIHGAILAEANTETGGRFKAGLPRKSDGQLLFLQHMISKMRTDATGSRIAVVMSASPLFAGGAGQGESKIRRWALESDWVEAIIGLPIQMFYNTGIQTFVWILSNRKKPARQGNVQLIDASGPEFWSAMPRSLGDKRRELTQGGIDRIVRAFGSIGASSDGVPWCKVVPSSSFGYRRITVERPLRLSFDLSEAGRESLVSSTGWDEARAEIRELAERIIGHMPASSWRDREEFLRSVVQAARPLGIRLSGPQKKALAALIGTRDAEAEICRDAGGRPEPDVDLRDYENVPLDGDWLAIFERDVLPWYPDAWVDTSVCDPGDKEVGVIGYEIPFNRHFYKPPEQRPLAEIDGELRTLSGRLAQGIAELVP